MIDLGGLGGQFRYNRSLSINDRGQIVGASGTTGWGMTSTSPKGLRAVLWTLKRG
jgi:hypothetical protein